MVIKKVGLYKYGQHGIINGAFLFITRLYRHVL